GLPLPSSNRNCEFFYGLLTAGAAEVGPAVAFARPGLFTARREQHAHHSASDSQEKQLHTSPCPLRFQGQPSHLRIQCVRAGSKRRLYITSAGHSLSLSASG